MRKPIALTLLCGIPTAALAHLPDGDATPGDTLRHVLLDPHHLPVVIALVSVALAAVLLAVLPRVPSFTGRRADRRRESGKSSRSR